MGKRDEQRKLKLCVLGKIKEKRGTLFGAFSDTLSKSDKVDAWKEINDYALSLGLVPPHKGWAYIRDVWWPNVRKSSTEKRDNFKKTGTGGGKDFKLNEVDEEVLNIIGKTSPVVAGLDIPESLEDQQITKVSEEKLIPCEIVHDKTLLEENLEIVSEKETEIPTSKKTTAGKKRKQSDINNSPNEKTSEKNDWQIKLLKFQIYKTKLEIRKLEISMGLPASLYTSDIQHNEGIFVIDEENCENLPTELIHINS